MRKGLQLASKPAFITTPIFYVNSSPHLGHLYSVTLADAWKRWSVIRGRETYFMVGTDEHGVKIQDAASRAKMNCEAFCDKHSDQFRQLFKAGHISADDFLRTSEARHAKAVTRMWKTLTDNGAIYMDRHQGWYSKSDEAFIPQTQLLKENKGGGEIWVTEAGHPVVWIEEPNYKFRFSQYQDKVRNWLANDVKILPESRKEEALAMLREEVGDISVSRLRDKVSWAIPVPEDPSHSIYVWLDALSVYLTATGFPDTSPTSLNGLWPPDVQVLGKDILKFHALYWPAFLIAAGLPLPKSLMVHGHWLSDNRKMSKSLGNVVNPISLLHDGDEKSVFALRYFLLAEGNPLEDSNFSMQDYYKRGNELANVLGNLICRAMSSRLLSNNQIPSMGKTIENDNILIEQINNVAGLVDIEFQNFNFPSGLRFVFNLLRSINRLISDEQPWTEVCGIERRNTIMRMSLEALAVCSILLQPILPSHSTRVLNRLHIPNEKRNLENCRFGILETGRILDTLTFDDVLFTKFTAPAETTAKKKPEPVEKKKSMS